MTVKEIIKKIGEAEQFKDKYEISDADIDLVLRTAGIKGKRVLRLLYVLVDKSVNSSLSANATANNVYKILQTKFN